MRSVRKSWSTGEKRVERRTIRLVFFLSFLGLPRRGLEIRIKKKRTRRRVIYPANPQHQRRYFSLHLARIPTPATVINGNRCRWHAGRPCRNEIFRSSYFPPRLIPTTRSAPSRSIETPVTFPVTTCLILMDGIFDTPSACARFSFFPHPQSRVVSFRNSLLESRSRFEFVLFS